MRREEMLLYLATLDPAERLPIWAISYKRAGKAPMLERLNRFERTDDVHVVVRSSEAEAYRLAYPRLVIHGIDDDLISTCGAARWMAADLAVAEGSDRGIMLDDDITQLEPLFEGSFKTGPNAGQEKSTHAPTIGEQLRPIDEYVLMAFGDVAQEVLDREPDTVLGSINRRQMSFDPKNHRTKYVVNLGLKPTTVMVWDFARLAEKGIRLDQEKFGFHGEDIGLTVEALAAGADCFSVPSFVFGHWPESINILKSVIRNADNARELHEIEHEHLMSYPARDYLRVKRSILDGSFEWADINWQKCNALRGRPSKRVLWTGEEIVK